MRPGAFIPDIALDPTLEPNLTPTLAARSPSATPACPDYPSGSFRLRCCNACRRLDLPEQGVQQPQLCLARGVQNVQRCQARRRRRDARWSRRDAAATTPRWAPWSRGAGTPRDVRRTTAECLRRISSAAAAAAAAAPRIRCSGSRWLWCCPGVRCSCCSKRVQPVRRRLWRSGVLSQHLGSTCNETLPPYEKESLSTDAHHQHDSLRVKEICLRVICRTIRGSLDSIEGVGVCVPVELISITWAVRVYKELRTVQSHGFFSLAPNIELPTRTLVDPTSIACS
jgi:hypothetical protein